jgi:hypothetical protein
MTLAQTWPFHLALAPQSEGFIRRKKKDNTFSGFCTRTLIRAAINSQQQNLILLESVISNMVVADDGEPIAFVAAI